MNTCTCIGKKVSSKVENLHDGNHKCIYTAPEIGLHKITVLYDGLSVPGSPFTVTVTTGFDINKVRAFGPGLQGGFTKESQMFTIETKGAGQGSLGLSIGGPSEAKLISKDNLDGSCQVKYLPRKPGTYEIAIRFADKDIPGSPFSVPIKDHIDVTKVFAYGLGVGQDPPGTTLRGQYSGAVLRAKKPAEFVVETTNAGQGALEVTYTDKFGYEKPADIRPHDEGLFDVVYYPEVEGICH